MKEQKRWLDVLHTQWYAPYLLASSTLLPFAGHMHYAKTSSRSFQVLKSPNYFNFREKTEHMHSTFETGSLGIQIQNDQFSSRKSVRAPFKPRLWSYSVTRQSTNHVMHASIQKNAHWSLYYQTQILFYVIFHGVYTRIILEKILTPLAVWAWFDISTFAFAGLFESALLVPHQVVSCSRFPLVWWGVWYDSLSSSHLLQ